MFQQFYASNPLLFWPLVGLVIFLASFAAVMFYVFVGLRDKEKRQHLASLPLAPDEELRVPTGDARIAGGRV